MKTFHTASKLLRRSRFVARLARRWDIPEIQSLYEKNGFQLGSIPSERELLNRMGDFELGEMVVVRANTNEVVCYASTIPIYEEVAERGELSAEQLKMAASENGNSLLRQVFLVHPSTSAYGPSKLIDRACKNLAERRQCHSILAASRVPGYRALSNIIPFEKYVGMLSDGLMLNKNVNLWKAEGYKILKGLPNFRKADLQSAGCAVLMEWKPGWLRLPHLFTQYLYPKPLISILQFGNTEGLC